ncbi:DinB family protein [Janibacter corallicola]|uniref:DinB family protein n=1 Tax=Janibacter corallicola TaxID=415212 RepID=UPI000835976B|nr:DinB family protein [Janibacter corallicola]
MDAAPSPADHDSTDWTFVVDQGCSQCGYRPHDPRETGARLEALVPRWAEVLRRPDATRRPEPGVWSPVEYASHSRDLVRVLGERVALMTSREDPPFADYDGEAEAVRQEFWGADPTVVADQVAARTAETVQVLGEVTDWERTGQRGGGRRFTVTQLCRYLLHDVEHHVHDVAG